MKTTKNLLMTAAVTGALSALTLGLQAETLNPASGPSADKEGCSGKDGCKGKDKDDKGKDGQGKKGKGDKDDKGKDGCAGKDGCSGKEGK